MLHRRVETAWCPHQYFEILVRKTVLTDIVWLAVFSKKNGTMMPPTQYLHQKGTRSECMCVWTIICEFSESQMRQFSRLTKPNEPFRWRWFYFKNQHLLSVVHNLLFLSQLIFVIMKMQIFRCRQLFEMSNSWPRRRIDVPGHSATQSRTAQSFVWKDLLKDGWTA